MCWGAYVDSNVSDRNEMVMEHIVRKPKIDNPRLTAVALYRVTLWHRREQKYQEKLALKKAQRRAAESQQEKAERKQKAKMEGTAAHFG